VRGVSPWICDVDEHNRASIFSNIWKQDPQSTIPIQCPPLIRGDRRRPKSCLRFFWRPFVRSSAVVTDSCRSRRGVISIKGKVEADLQSSSCSYPGIKINRVYEMSGSAGLLSSDTMLKLKPRVNLRLEFEAAELS